MDSPATSHQRARACREDWPRCCHLSTFPPNDANHLLLGGVGDMPRPYPDQRFIQSQIRPIKRARPPLNVDHPRRWRKLPLGSCRHGLCCHCHCHRHRLVPLVSYGPPSCAVLPLPRICPVLLRPHPNRQACPEETSVRSRHQDHFRFRPGSISYHRCAYRATCRKPPPFN